MNEFHTTDSDCTIVDGECAICLVVHGDPCLRCGGTGYHAFEASESGAPIQSKTCWYLYRELMNLMREERKVIPFESISAGTGTPAKITRRTQPGAPASSPDDVTDRAAGAGWSEAGS